MRLCDLLDVLPNGVNFKLFLINDMDIFITTGICNLDSCDLIGGFTTKWMLVDFGDYEFYEVFRLNILDHSMDVFIYDPDDPDVIGYEVGFF